MGLDKALGLIGMGVPTFSDDPDPGSGKYTMNKYAYLLTELITSPVGLLTQTPRYIKAIKNPAFEESWKEGALWMFQSLLRAGAPSPYAGRRNVEGSMRDFTEAFSKRETADMFKQAEDPRNPRFR